MPLRDLYATAHPEGCRIDLSWRNPDAARFPGMRILRRRSHFPLSPEDTDEDTEVALVLDDPAFEPTLAHNGERRFNHIDEEGLHGETTYYYALFPYAPGPPRRYLTDNKNRAAALATSSYGVAAQLYQLLPRIYHRYDNALAQTPPSGLAPEDLENGPLRRLLDIVGGQLDLVQSHAKAVEDLHDLSRIDGRLLPLLAEWIGWRTNFRLGFDGQRRELRHAPSIYETTGIVPTTEATVKRLLGWESRTKTFADNLLLTNRPERLNLVLQRRTDGRWRSPAESIETDGQGVRIPGRDAPPLSLNFAYEGRASAVAEDDGRSLWLFFHTLRKTSVATTTTAGSCRFGRWDIWLKRYTQGAWQPSEPLTTDESLERHPTGAWHAGRLWVFWDRWVEADRRWRLMFTTRESDSWQTPAALWPEGIESDRKHPVAVTDEEGGLWLFWLRRTGRTWRIEYNRHDGTDWLRPPDAPGEVPRTTAGERVSDGPFSVLIHPTEEARRLWLFWQRRTVVDLDGQRQHRRRIAWRTKSTLDVFEPDWSGATDLAAAEPEANDVDPAAIVGAEGNVELFWSSNRDRSFSVWNADLDLTSETWGSARPITTNPFNQRGPAVIPFGGETWLIYGSNESLNYRSDTYGATTTLDTRGAGSTSLHVRNAAKLALLSRIDAETNERRGGDFRDFNCYSVDTGENNERANRNWYAPDTVGLYLTPTSHDPSVIGDDRRRVEEVLEQFLPIQLRTVFIIEPPAYVEKVYTYEFRDDEEQRLIGELAYDSTLPETYRGARDSHEDIAPNWVWMLTWSQTTPERLTVDFEATPIDTSARTWTIAVTPGEAL